MILLTLYNCITLHFATFAQNTFESEIIEESCSRFTFTSKNLKMKKVSNLITWSTRSADRIENFKITCPRRSIVFFQTRSLHERSSFLFSRLILIETGTFRFRLHFDIMRNRFYSGGMTIVRAGWTQRARHWRQYADVSNDMLSRSFPFSRDSRILYARRRAT